MEIKILETLPLTYKNTAGKSYDTRYVYTGFKRYDIEKKILSEMKVEKDNRILYSEQVIDTTVFPRDYHTEMVRVTIYSDSPKVWCEELSPDERYFFVQQPTQAASTC